MIYYLQLGSGQTYNTKYITTIGDFFTILATDSTTHLSWTVACFTVNSGNKIHTGLVNNMWSLTLNEYFDVIRP